MRNFPTVHELLDYFHEKPWTPPETRAEVAVRILQLLSKLPSWEWKKLHYKIGQWYDKCQQLLEKSGELLYYPELESVAKTPEQYFRDIANDNTKQRRIMELLLQDFTLSPREIRDILKSENVQIELTSATYAVLAAKCLLALLHDTGVIDLTQLYKAPSDENNAQTLD